LAGMLEQVRKRQLPAAAVELMAALGGFGQQDAADPDAVADVADPDAVADAAEADPVADCMPKAGFGTQAMPAIVPRPDCEPESGTGLQAAAGNGPEQPAVEVPAGAVARAAHNAALIGQVMQEGDAARKNVDRHKISHVRGEQVRVPAGLLDDMVNLAGEITIYRSRIEQQVSDYRFNLNELEQTIGRLHEQLRLMEIETETQTLFRFEQDVDRQQTGFDLLEMDRYSNLQQLSRSMIEGISDLLSISELMEGTVRESEVLLLQQSRVNTRLQDGLIRTRMIPFSELAPRLRRVLRQAAQALGKKVDLELAGAEGEIDRTVVGRIIAPLEHMLRNAVAHGIETPEQRLQAGKAETGVVTITMQREGSEIVLCIADDGAGLDL
ncbi:MAG: histidine kinase, partial [Gammaproteobacteria bacterium]